MVTYIELIKLSEQFTNFELDAFQIMPNHIHGIIMMNSLRATLSVDLNDGVNANGAPARVAHTIAQNNVVIGNGVLVSFEKYSFTNNGYFYTKK